MFFVFLFILILPVYLFVLSFCYRTKVDHGPCPLRRTHGGLLNLICRYLILLFDFFHKIRVVSTSQMRFYILCSTDTFLCTYTTPPSSYIYSDTRTQRPQVVPRGTSKFMLILLDPSSRNISAKSQGKLRIKELMREWSFFSSFSCKPSFRTPVLLSRPQFQF